MVMQIKLVCCCGALITAISPRFACAIAWREERIQYKIQYEYSFPPESDSDEKGNMPWVQWFLGYFG